MSNNTKVLNLGECPACHSDLTDLAIPEGSPIVSDGDMAVCWECGAVLKLSSGKMVSLSVAEVYKEFSGNLGHALTVLAISKVVKNRIRAETAHLN